MRTKRMVLTALAATLAVAAAVVVPVGGTVAAAADPSPPMAADGWVGTVSLDHEMAYGPTGTNTTSITATFSQSGFKDAASWASRFPNSDFEQPNGRLWVQDFHVDFSQDIVVPEGAEEPFPGGVFCPSGFTLAASGSADVTDAPLNGSWSFGQVAIGDFGGGVGDYGHGQALWLDIEGRVPEVSVVRNQTFPGSEHCTAQPPNHTETVEDWGFHFDTLSGNWDFSLSKESAFDIPAQWPGTPASDGQIHLTGSKTIVGYDTESNEATSVVSWDLTWVPGGIDTDGDGLTDSTDDCPTTKGPASNGGCPRQDCTGDVANRGYVVSEHDAEINTLLGDPDLFRFDVSGRWCEADGLLEVDTVDVQGFVTTSPTLATALELLGFTFVYDEEESSAIPTESGSTGEITGIGQFDGCFDWLALAGSGAGSKVLGKAAKAIGRAAARAIPPPRRLIDIDGTTDGVIEAISARLVSLAEDVRALFVRTLRRALPNGFADSLGVAVRDAISAATNTLLTDVRTLVDGKLREVHALPTARQRVALNAVKQDIEKDLQAKISQLIDTTQCFDVWQPEVTITVPASGSSSVAIGGFTNPFLEVSGGITTDVR